MRKKIWISLILVVMVLIPLSGYKFWYVPNYGGDDYYTYVGDSYKEIIEKDDSGNDYHEFSYKQKAYDKSGNEKLLKFDSTIGRPIKANNYLKVTYNPKRDRVMSWEKVSKTSIPRKSLQAILE